MKEKLIAILKERSVKFGEFTLASGKKSDFYVDARLTTLHPKGSHLIAQLILEKLSPEVQAIGGPVTGADPITGAVTMLAGQQGKSIYGFMVRKQPKGYGGKQWIEGLANLPRNAKVCIIEDTVTTGGSLLKAVEKLEEAGLQVVQCIAVVDREEGAMEKITNSGYPFLALVRKTDLL